MYYDSQAIIAGHENVFAQKGITGVIGIFPQRPIPMISFYLNYLVDGMNPYYFRVVNAALLGIAALLVIIAIVLMIEAPNSGIQPGQVGTRPVAFVMGLLFLVHPIQTFLVVYIWQRMALLAIMCCMASFASYIAVRSGRLENRILGYSLCILMFLFAMLSKENAVTLPAVLLLAEIAFFRPSWNELAKRALAFAVVTVSTLVFMSYLERPHGSTEAGTGLYAALFKYSSEGGMTLWEIFVTQCRMLFLYISAIIVPTPERLQLLTPQYLSESLLESSTTTLAVIAAIILTISGVYLLRKRPLTGFGILFFIVNLLPESFLVPQYSFVLYRAVFPMIGLLIIIADLVMSVFARTESGHVGRWIRAPLIACAAGAILFFSWVSFTKADVWRDPLLFWQEAVDQIPPHAANLEKRSVVQALNQLGLQLQLKNRHAEAVPLHERALQIPNRREGSSMFLGKAYMALGRVDDAERMFSLCMKTNPTFPEGYAGLAAVLVKKNRLKEALELMRKALDLAPENYDYQVRTGMILLKQGNFPGAISHFSRAVELNPKYAEAHYQLGKALLDRNPEQGSSHIYKSLQLDPGHSLANVEIGVMLATSGRLQEAEAHFRRALKRNPNDELANENLETVQRQLSETSDK